MPNIKIYSTPTCHYCHMTKEFLNEHHVAYEEYDVSKDAMRREEMIQKSGQLGVPVIDVNGEIIIGFDPAKLSNLLGIGEAVRA